jgi:hypothetical protein
MYLFQIGVHARVSLGLVGQGDGHRRRVTSVGSDLFGQLHPAQPELHEAALRLRKSRETPHSPAAATMKRTMKFSMLDASLR